MFGERVSPHDPNLPRCPTVFDLQIELISTLGDQFMLGCHD